MIKLSDNVHCEQTQNGRQVIVESLLDTAHRGSNLGTHSKGILLILGKQNLIKHLDNHLIVNVILWLMKKASWKFLEFSQKAIPHFCKNSRRESHYGRLES